jgi:DNA-binding NarL/FixJ family response regulator
VTEASRPGRVVVLADDLIWATRLTGQLRTLGAEPVRAASAEALARELPAARVVVDLTSRRYDGVTGVAAAKAAGARVLAVGQHDDAPLRRAALAAGADRVFSYRALFEHGHAALAAWLGVEVPAPGSIDIPSSATQESPAP